MNTFSICIIAKNEEKHIERCLKAASALNAEIVIVDTGSTDATKEIAAKYTDKLYDFTWIQDFSAARNFSIEKASNDWILVLDCDEYVTDFDLDDIQTFMKKYPKAIGEITHRNLLGSAATGEETIYLDYLGRFFHRKHYTYKGSIHEQISPLPGTSFDLRRINISALHDGYFGSPEERYEKNMRNIHMLEDSLTKTPLDAYLNYQLGQSYYSVKNFEKAVTHYRIALDQPIDFHSPLGHSLACGYINCLNELHQSEKALELMPHYEELSEYADFVLLMGHVYTNLGQYLQAMGQYLKATTIPKYHKEGVNTYLPFYHIGNIYAAMGDNNMASMMYKKCGDYRPAQQALAKLT